MQSLRLYQKYSDGKHWEKHPTIYAETFSKFLNKIGFKGLIVDIGCGNGRDVNVFSKSGFDAFGVDNSEEEIKSNKKNFPKLKFDVQDAEALSFKDNSVGAFFMINVIHYVNKKKAIDEVLRALKSKGYFFIHFNLEILDKNGNIDYSHKLADILKLISKFKIIQQTMFERIDKSPVEHKHKIIELILQKP